jgi:hypothetical protein
MVAESNPSGQARKPPASDMKDGPEHTTIRITEGRSPVCTTDAEPFLIGIVGTCMKSSRTAILAVLERALRTLEPFQVLTDSIVISIGDERYRNTPNSTEKRYVASCAECEQSRVFRSSWERTDWASKHQEEGHNVELSEEYRALVPKTEPTEPAVIWDATGFEWRRLKNGTGYTNVSDDGEPWPLERVKESFGPVSTTRPEEWHTNWATNDS